MAIPLTANACLSHHREGYVMVSCLGCGHRRDIRAEALARIFGWDVKVRALVPRFRCSACGKREVDVRFGYDSRPRGWAKNPS